MPLVIAHRGASAEAPENTLAAIQRAIELGADGIELDILLTKDHIPIVTHNNNLSLLTDHPGFAHLTPWSIIRELDVGSRLHPSWSGHRIPLLTEVFEMLAPHDVSLMLELKYQPGHTAAVVRKVLETVKRFAFRRAPTLASFSLGILWACKRVERSARRAIIVSRGPLATFRSTRAADFLDVQVVMASLTAASQKLRQHTRAAHRQLYLWTINTPDDVLRALEFEPDGIITDDVAMSQKRLHDLRK